MRKQGFELEKVTWLKHGYIVSRSPIRPTLGSTIEYLAGFYYIQGIASMIPAYVLSPEPGEVVLDMASAPGGKTTQIAQLMKNRGLLVAVEKNGERVKSLRENLRRMGVRNTIVYRTLPDTLLKSGIRFDKVLLDAPCSGEGGYGEKFLRLPSRTKEDFQDLTNRQKMLLETAVKLVKRGGRIVYSTCSIAPEEDEEVIDYALKTLNVSLEDVSGFPGSPGLVRFLDKEFTQEVSKCLRLYPHVHRTEGFFLCSMIRN